MILVRGRGENNMESILRSVKKQIGLDPEYTQFDPDIIMSINTVFVILNRVGVGPSTGFRIEDESAEWTDFLPDDDLNFDAVKTYIAAKVRLIFDPPTSSIIIQATKEVIAELEWTLNINAETSQSEGR